MKFSFELKTGVKQIHLYNYIQQPQLKLSTLMYLESKDGTLMLLITIVIRNGKFLMTMLSQIKQYMF